MDFKVLVLEGMDWGKVFEGMDWGKVRGPCERGDEIWF
jgi:hypothetical protein